MVNRRYDRVIIMIKQEVPGYAFGGRDPSGHATIEVRNGKGKMTTVMQSLINSGNRYRLYLISADYKKAIGINCGALTVDEKGRAESRWEFDPENVGDSGLKIEEFNVVAVIVIGKGNTLNTKDIIAPAVGYKDSKVVWKNLFQAYTKEVAVEAPPVPLVPQDRTEVVQEATQEVVQEMPQEVAQIESPVEEKELVATEEPAQQLALDEVEEVEEVQEVQKIEAVEETKFATKADFFNEIEVGMAEAHKEFKEKIVQFASQDYDREPEELEAQLPDNSPFNYRFFEKDEPMERNIVQEQQPSLDDIDYMYENNPVMRPFESQYKNYKWVRISINEISALPLDVWTYGNHPFMLVSYKKYNHLILGTYFESPAKSHILGVPGVYNPKLRLAASRLGFKQFKCCEDKVPVLGDYGYWLMSVSVEE